MNDDKTLHAVVSIHKPAKQHVAAVKGTRRQPHDGSLKTSRHPSLSLLFFGVLVCAALLVVGVYVRGPTRNRRGLGGPGPLTSQRLQALEGRLGAPRPPVVPAPQLQVVVETLSNPSQAPATHEDAPSLPVVQRDDVTAAAAVSLKSNESLTYYAAVMLRHTSFASSVNGSSQQHQWFPRAQPLAPHRYYPNVLTSPLTFREQREGSRPPLPTTRFQEHSNEPSNLIEDLYADPSLDHAADNSGNADNDDAFFAAMDRGQYTLHPLRIMDTHFASAGNDVSGEKRTGAHASTAPEGLHSYWSKYRPRLQKLLRRYQRFHAEAIRRLRSRGAEQQQQQQQAPSASPLTANDYAQFVVVRPVGQLCNRLVAITSAFVFALLTRRVLLVDDEGFYASLKDLFTTPGLEWILPQGEPASFIANAVGSQGVREFTVENPDGGVWSEMEKLLCGDLRRAYASPARPSTVVFTVNQYLVPLFYRNPHYVEPLRALVGLPPAAALEAWQWSADDLFGPLAHFLFRPTADLLRRRDAYIANHFYDHVRLVPATVTHRETIAVGGGAVDWVEAAAADTPPSASPAVSVLVPSFVVGLQVRSGGDFTDHFMSAADWALYRDCGAQAAPPDVHDPFPATGQLKTPHPLHDSAYIQVHVPCRDDPARHCGVAAVRRRFKFFVATDTAKGRDAASLQLQRDGAPAVGVLFGPGEFQLSNNPPGVQLALLDLLLLAAADDRVTTAWSSFGYFAAGISGVDANLVTNRAPALHAAADAAGVPWAGPAPATLSIINRGTLSRDRSHTQWSSTLGGADGPQKEAVLQVQLPGARTGPSSGGVGTGSALLIGSHGGGAAANTDAFQQPLDTRESEQRFMGVMHKSDRRVQCARLPTHEPCFHKFESWGASTTTCYNWRTMTFPEMIRGGRYC